MKKIILGVLAATLAAGPIALTAAEAAPIQRDDRGYDRRDDRGYDRRDDRRNGADARRAGSPNDFRSWRKGQRFDRRYARDYREIDYRTYRGRGLYAPPRGYRWVRSGNDAVLVAIAGGLIGAVIGNAIR